MPLAHTHTCLRALAPLLVVSMFGRPVLAHSGDARAVRCLDAQASHARIQHAPTRPLDDAHGGIVDWETIASLGVQTSSGCEVRVFWTTDGLDAPDLSDADADGFPDSVQLVAQHAVRAFETAARSGFSPPLVLSPQEADSHVEPCTSGRGHVPIYMKHFEAGDGQLLRLSCEQLEAGRAPVCAGALVIENDFQGTGYSSFDEAVGIVTSHELFHAIQYAYRDDFPAWFSEGSATWFEELHHPEQSDFERLSAYYFADHHRSLDDIQRGPGDAFAYGAAIFFYFLHQRYGLDLLVDLLETAYADEFLADPVDLLEVALQPQGVSLIGAWLEFMRWNLFTGNLRAGRATSYPDPERFGAVTLEPLPIDGERIDVAIKIDPLASRYLSFVAPHDGTLSLSVSDAWPAPLIELIDLDDPSYGNELGDEGALSFEASRHYAILISAADTTRTHAAYLSFRASKPPAEEMEEEEEEMKEQEEQPPKDSPMNPGPSDDEVPPSEQMSGQPPTEQDDTGDAACAMVSPSRQARQTIPLALIMALCVGSLGRANRRER